MPGLRHIYRSLRSGGIKPPDYKQPTLRSRIMPTPIPEQLVLPLDQHQGLSSEPCVKPGDRVRKYQLLAQANQAGMLNLHAPSSGEITSVDTEVDLFGDGQSQTCIQLRCDGEDAAEPVNANIDYRSMNQSELLHLIEAAGICGMGGAGFPTATKISAGLEQGIDCLLINAAECEPYISCDEALLRERSNEVVCGAEILSNACAARKTVIAIESDKTDAIKALRHALTDSSLTLELVPPRYPIGDERQLLYQVTGARLSRDALPIDAGMLVFNVGTAAAVFQAVVEGKPCISRIVSVSGAPLRTPKNFEVLIGTPVAHLLSLCGVDAAQHQQTIIGGSLMGKYLSSTAYPICKTSNSVIATSVSEFPAPEQELACIRCGLCADACPVNLLPQQLLAYSRAHQYEQATNHGLDDCIECGACAWVCPSHIPLVQYYRSAREIIAHDRNERQISSQWQSRFQYHQYRHKKIQDRKKEQRATAADVADSNNSSFSREQARAEIAAAVARVKQKRNQQPD